MSNGPNCNQKPQLSGILTEPLNPRAVRFFLRSNTKSLTSGLVIRHIKVQRDTKHLFKSMLVFFLMFFKEKYLNCEFKS